MTSGAVIFIFPLLSFEGNWGSEKREKMTYMFNVWLYTTWISLLFDLNI